jgi:hypothetical protein
MKIGDETSLQIIRLLAETVGNDKKTASIKAMSSVLGNALYRIPDEGAKLYSNQFTWHKGHAATKPCLILKLPLIIAYPHNGLYLLCEF